MTHDLTATAPPVPKPDWYNPPDAVPPVVQERDAQRPTPPPLPLGVVLFALLALLVAAAAVAAIVVVNITGYSLS